MFGSGGGAGYALHTDDDNNDDLDLPPYMGSFNFGESDPDLVEEGVEVVDGEQFYNAMAPVDHHLSSSTIATDDADGVIMDDPSLLLEPAMPNDYEVDSATSTSEATATDVAERTDISSPSLHTELDIATGSAKMVQSVPVSMSQRRTKEEITTGVSISALAAAALTNEFHRLDGIPTRNKQAQSWSGDQEHPVSAERNSVGSTPSENESQSTSTPAKAGGKRRKAAAVAAAGVGIAGLATIAVYGNRILKRFRDDDGDNEEAANYEVQDQDFGGDLYAQQQQGQAQPQSQGQGQTAQGPTGAEQGAAQTGQAVAQTQLQVAQAMVAQASSGIASSAGAVGGAAGAAAAAAAAATAAGEALLDIVHDMLALYLFIHVSSDRCIYLSPICLNALYLFPSFLFRLNVCNRSWGSR